MVDELDVEVDVELAPDPSTAVPKTPTAQEEPGRPASNAHHTMPFVAPMTPPNVAPPTHELAGAPDDYSVAVTRPAPIDLGIGTYWKTVAMSAPSSRPADRAVSPVTQMVRDELDARDLARGLGGGGALVSAAREAASATIAPDVGSATFDVESDATGRVVSARVVTATGDIAAWNAVATELIRIMSGKTMRVRPSSRGVRARVSVSATRTPPSGTKSTVSAGAVPDDVPGSDPVCEGAGARRRCTAGLPIGVTANSVDVANVVAKAVRVVRVQLLSETSL